LFGIIQSNIHLYLSSSIKLVNVFNTKNDYAIKATEAYVQLAHKHGLDPAQMALAYVNSRSFLSSNIIGATTMAQLKTDIASINLELDEQVLEVIEAIHQQHPNPCP